MKKELRKMGLLLWLIVLRLVYHPIEFLAYRFDQLAEKIDNYADEIEEKTDEIRSEQ